MQRYFSQNKQLWNFLARISFGAFETRCPVDSLLNKLAALSLSLTLSRSLNHSLVITHTVFLSLSIYIAKSKNQAKFIDNFFHAFLNK